MFPESPVKEKVTVREGTLTLPTYRVTGQNPNPVFKSQYGVAHIYPYTLLDEIDSKAQPVEYRTLELENRYLRVTVLPDLGGRVFSVYDKIAEKEVFYKNSTIKFSPLAIRGAFFSGGVEFSFPVAHAPTTADPVNWETFENPDGSAGVVFGGLEHISQMRWRIRLTLYPNRCALSQDVELDNPSTVPGRYHYWTNASVVADDSLEFIYPFHRVRSYEFAGTASWPVSRLDLITQNPGLPGMEGVPMWPAGRMLEPFNFRWQKNMLAQVSIFGRDVKWDFFGAWRHSENHGYAHFAKYRDVSGMKLWSWGNAEVGVVNQTALTDDGSEYAETQCGAMETQLDFDFLPPGKKRSWREWWLPFRSMGGLTCASEVVGAKLRLVPVGDQIRLEAGVCPVVPLEGASFRIDCSGKTLLETKIDVSPEEPWTGEAMVSAEEIGDRPIRLLVQDRAGEKLLEWVFDRSPVTEEPEDEADEFEGAEAFYRQGLKHENFDNRAEARAAYRQALEIDPDHAAANLRLGLMLFRSAEWDAARHHFEAAARAGTLEGYYYLGQLHRVQGYLDAAVRAYRQVPDGNPLKAAALAGEGVVALSQKQWDAAVDALAKAQSADPESIHFKVLYGIALRRAGKTEQARQVLEEVLTADPLNHPALFELSRLDEQHGADFLQRLNRMLADDRQYILDLSVYYLRAGLPEDALTVLANAADWDYSMRYYLAAFIAHGLEWKGESDEWLQKAAAADTAFGFPSRIEEVQALEFVLERSPDDGKAHLYLGNFCYARERYTEGVMHWERARALLGDQDMILRNLGLAAWEQQKDLEGAVALFERALAINPENQDLYLHLDDLYQSLGQVDKRERLLEKIDALPHLREDVRKRRVKMLVELGHFDRALTLLEETYMPLEMDQSFHNVYVAALMQRAEKHLAEGQIEAAIVDYRKALEFPPNLGVGRPLHMEQAEVLYALGCAYERIGKYADALACWDQAAREHHPYGTRLYSFVQKSLDKLGRYSELGLSAG